VILGANARFESGQIDLTSDEEGETPNQIINTTGTPAVGLQFENAPGILPSELTIVDRTLGNTVFNGYTPSGSFYVRFENGAILEDDGSVIVIDGTDANFDGIRPATFPGTILPQATLDFIEDRLFDADDTVANGRGQIFVGFPPSITIENFEDFIRQLGGVPQDAPIANLQITGLPPVQLGPQGLNNIAPAGGEQTPEQLAGITPAAGGDDETAPQNIEPAAGGEDVSCWSDALNDAETGTITNYSFGGTFEDSIAANAGCGAQEG
jgi:hypothetical protein